MDTKNYIINRLEKAGVKCSVASLSRYIAATRSPDLATARALSQIVRTKKTIWLDKQFKEQRQTAIQQFSQKKGLPLYSAKGRPGRQS